MDKDTLMMKTQENIATPLQWPAPHECQIIDLKDQHYDDVLRLIKHHFFADDPMCKSLKLLNDKMSTQSYLQVIEFWMKDTTSLVAISSRSGRVIGTAIARINTNSDASNTYSRMKITQGEVLRKLMHLKNTLVSQANVYNQLKHDTIFRVYILCVHPSYRQKGLEMALLEACIRMTIALEIPVIVGIFTSCETQKLASTVGLKVLSEIYYNRWIVNDEIVFDNPGIGNYSAAFMGMSTPSLDYLDDLRRAREDAKSEEEYQRKKIRQHS